MLSAMDAIFQRRSIHAYQDRPVERKELELLRRAAMAAPPHRVYWGHRETRKRRAKAKDAKHMDMSAPIELSGK